MKFSPFFGGENWLQTKKTLVFLNTVFSTIKHYYSKVSAITSELTSLLCVALLTNQSKENYFLAVYGLGDPA
jgi:hypothetical protein